MTMLPGEAVACSSRETFPWHTLRMIIEGGSPLELPRLSVSSREEAYEFLRHYGFDLTKEHDRHRLLDIHHEAVAFINKYFLMRRNGKPLFHIPKELATSRDPADLLLVASRSDGKPLALWACAVLRVMHTIHHANLAFERHMLDEIRRQVLDPFRRCLQVDELGCPMLVKGDHRVQLEGVFFKEGKSRDSILLKLLHKPDNVAQQIYDVIGVQFVTRTRLEALLVVRFLTMHNLVISANVVPGRSINNLVDLDAFQKMYEELEATVLHGGHDMMFLEHLNNESREFAKLEATLRNPFSGSEYRSVQFTCQQLIRVPNPTRGQMARMLRTIRDHGDRELLRATVAQCRRFHVEKEQSFFFPFEVQILDFENYLKTSMGESSHAAYKKRQVLAAQRRVLQGLL